MILFFSLNARTEHIAVAKSPCNEECGAAVRQRLTGCALVLMAGGIAPTGSPGRILPDAVEKRPALIEAVDRAVSQRRGRAPQERRGVPHRQPLRRDPHPRRRARKSARLSHLDLLCRRAHLRVVRNEEIAERWLVALFGDDRPRVKPYGAATPVGLAKGVRHFLLEVER